MGKVRLAELDCHRLQFQDGDRILVYVYFNPSKEVVDRITKTIRKWAGKELEVLVLDKRFVSLEVAQQPPIISSYDTLLRPSNL